MDPQNAKHIQAIFWNSKSTSRHSISVRHLRPVARRPCSWSWSSRVGAPPTPPDSASKGGGGGGGRVLPSFNHPQKKKRSSYRAARGLPSFNHPKTTKVSAVPHQKRPNHNVPLGQVKVRPLQQLPSQRVVWSPHKPLQEPGGSNPNPNSPGGCLIVTSVEIRRPLEKTNGTRKEPD